jgi:hypothetical protein
MQTSPAQKSWQEANKDYLMARLSPVREALKHACGREAVEDHTPMEAEAIEHERPAAFDNLIAAFDLSPFEQNMLLLCAGVELESEFAQLCATAQERSQNSSPTFNLALTLFSDPYWFALSPVAPLRFWRLIEIEKGHLLLFSPLRIDERILHYLVGLSYLDRRLANLFQPIAVSASLAPSHLAIANEIVATWAATETNSLPRIELYGSEPASERSIAALVGSLTGQRVLLLQSSALPTGTVELEEMLHLWEREILLDGGILLLDCQGTNEEHTANNVITRVVEVCAGALIISSRELRAWSQCALLAFEVRKPTGEEQLAIWQAVLSQQPVVPASLMPKLISHFSLDETAIHAISANVQGRLALSDREQLPATSEQFGIVLWEACRRHVRPGLGNLAQRMDTAATWEDLALPEIQRDMLRSIAMHVRQRGQVYETWGFASKTSRGLGISALFIGGSGTGKTMAAEVLANELHLDLYRIDLSTVVSKYIGETEKHLQRIFDAAEEGSALLLFDEADALLGKRSEVKDSHDRYANIEISYLLQRMEAYRGLVLLTTNMKDALDTAFLRRIRFIVQFPFPDAAQRAAIWQHVFPRAAPVENLNTTKLAQLNIAGGNIRNIALTAAFIASDAGEPIRMQHLFHAARYEYAKLEKTMTGAELEGWDL